jgi:branched-chain amino acid transport system substrate-binding protein
MLLMAVTVVVAACGSTANTETTAATTATTSGTTASSSGSDTTAASTATTGGSDTTAASTGTTTAATGTPIIVGFNEGMTGFMAVNAALCWHGVVLACEEQGQIAGHPIEYDLADNGSDPAQAVAKARQQVESKGVDVIIGPQYSPSAEAITQYLGTLGDKAIPQISVAPQPNANLKTANNLAFMAFGFYGNPDYQYAKYLVEKKGYKTCNIISYEDTASRQMVEKGTIPGFTDAGGKVLSQTWMAPDKVDFSAVLGGMPKADCTFIWIYGMGVPAFTKQYSDYGIAAQLCMIGGSGMVPDTVLTQIGQPALGMYGWDFANLESTDPAMQSFVKAYEARWDGEVPTFDSLGSYQATMIYFEGVKKTNGDTSFNTIIPALAAVNYTGPCGPTVFNPYEQCWYNTQEPMIVETVQQLPDRIGWGIEGGSVTGISGAPPK